MLQLLLVVMGNCSSLIRSRRTEDQKGLIESSQAAVQNVGENVNEDMVKKIKLINNWQSYQLQTIVEKVMGMCEYEKKNHMNFTLFLEFFPALKPMSMKTQLRYFDFFDLTRSSYINIREIIYGISQIYFTPKDQYWEVLKEIYKTSKGDGLNRAELKHFLSENRKLLSDDCEKDDNYKQYLKVQTPIKDADFKIMIVKYFNIKQYQLYFDFYETEKEMCILESLKVSDINYDLASNSKVSMRIKENMDIKASEVYKISIRMKEKVFLIDINWFQAWVKYMPTHGCYGITYEIEGPGDTVLERRNFSFEQVLTDNAALVRPPRIYNYDLLGQYESDLKPNLQMFEHFIPVPEDLWRSLQSIYKGGPEIERTYPNLFDLIVINKVYLDNKGRLVDNKIVQCKGQLKQLIAQIFKGQTKAAGYIYYKRVPTSANMQHLNIQEIQGLVKWHQLGRNTPIDQSMHHGFTCFVPENLKSIFQDNYQAYGPHSEIRRQQQLSYGKVISFKTYTHLDPDSNNREEEMKADAYVIGMHKNLVKLHFTQTSYTCDDYFEVDQVLKGIQDKKYVVTNKNMISTLEGLETCSYVNATLQVLIASPYFSDFFLKQKHIRSLSNGVNLQSSLSNSMSKLIYDVKKNQKHSVRPEDLYRKIQSKVEPAMFRQQIAQETDKFVSKFLEELSSELQNPEKLFDKYQIITEVDQGLNEDGSDKTKCSIIESFFKLSESTKNNCTGCNKDTFKQSHSYVLSVPLPDDEEVYYKVIFCPLNSLKFIQYAITIRRSQKFFKYAQKFAEVIKIDLPRISFTQVQAHQFRKHYTKFDYQTSLLNLGLSTFDVIYVFELKNPRSRKQLTYQEIQYSHSFNQFKPGDIVDFNMYTEWHVGKIIGSNRDKTTIENFQGHTQVDNRKIEQFKLKTEEKGWYQIDLLHRRINPTKQSSLEYFLTPSVMSIAEWMSWDEIIKQVKAYLKNYFSFQKSESASMASDPIEHDLLQRLIDHLGPSQLQIPLVPDVDNISGFLSAQGAVRQSRCSVSTSTDKPPYRIKVFLNNSGEVCAICLKKSIFQRFDRDFCHVNDKYCSGCQFKMSMGEPIGIKVNPAKISIVLDWIHRGTDPLIHKIQPKIQQDKTFQGVAAKIRSQINTIDDCFQLYTQTNKVEFKCPDCGLTISQQNRYLRRCPNLLVLHLKRFKNKEKLKNKIEIERELTIEKIQEQSKKEDIYELYAIICHRELSEGREKWYNCVLRSKNIWVKCCDTQATLIDFDKIDKEQIYMLFYRKKNIDCSLLSLIF